MTEEYIKKEDAIQSVMNHDLLKSDWSRAWAEYMLEDAPTIDAVPVVRCKDCKHFRTFRTSSDGEEIRTCVGKEIVDLNYDDFCSKGERDGSCRMWRCVRCAGWR